MDSEPCQNGIDQSLLSPDHPPPTDNGHNGRHNPRNEKGDPEKASSRHLLIEQNGQSESDRVASNYGKERKDGAEIKRMHKIGHVEQMEVILHPDKCSFLNQGSVCQTIEKSRQKRIKIDH